MSRQLTEISWDDLEPEYKWVSFDKNGKIYVWSNKPECVVSLDGWYWPEDSNHERMVFEFTGKRAEMNGPNEWKNCLWKRPEEENLMNIHDKWQKIDEGYNWLTIDADGAMFAWINKPIQAEDEWINDCESSYGFDENVYRVEDGFSFISEDAWKQCLWERPSKEEPEEGFVEIIRF